MKRLWICACLLLILSNGCVNINASLFGEGRRSLPNLTVVEEAEGKTKDRILLLDLTGFLSARSAGGFLKVGTGAGTLVTLKDQLLAAEEDDQIAACIVHIDTPGGGVTASDLIHHELIQFKEKMTEKRGETFPLIAHLGGIATSGGVYISMAADEIHALPTTTTGSIGVIAMWPGFAEISETLGVEMRVFKSGDKKDSGSPWRDMTDEERDLMQDIIDNMHQQFVTKIVESRSEKGLTRENLLPIADGRVFKARQALDAKLIDGIAYLDEVIADVKDDLGGDAEVVSFEYPGGYRGNIYAGSSPPAQETLVQAEINLLPDVLPGPLGFKGGMEDRFMYLWMP